MAIPLERRCGGEHRSWSPYWSGLPNFGNGDAHPCLLIDYGYGYRTETNCLGLLGLGVVSDVLLCLVNIQLVWRVSRGKQFPPCGGAIDGGGAGCMPRQRECARRGRSNHRMDECLHQGMPSSDSESTKSCHTRECPAQTRSRPRVAILTQTLQEKKPIFAESSTALFLLSLIGFVQDNLHIC